MPQRHTFGFQLFLHVRPVHAGLDPGDQGFLIHFQHPMHATHVEADNEPVLAILGFQAAGDVGAAAEGNEHRVVLVRSLHDGHHVLFTGGIHHEVRRDIYLPATQPEQIPKRLTGRVHQAILLGGGQLIGL